MVEAETVEVTAGGFISSNTEGPGQGGSIRVTARDTLTVSGVISSDSGSLASAISANTFGRNATAGDAGNLQLQARHIRLFDGGQIQSVTEEPGRAGSITLRLSDTLLLQGTDPLDTSSGILTSTRDFVEALAGHGGAIDVEAAQIDIQAGAQIATLTRGPGHGGDIRLVATQALTLAGTNPNGIPSGIFTQAQLIGLAVGNAGALDFFAPLVSVTDGARIGSGLSPAGHSVQGKMLGQTAMAR